MPTLDEVHQGIGSGELTTDFDREFLAEALPFRHLMFFRHGKLFGTTVILARTPSLEGITLVGYGLGFWSGIDKDGPIIERREYIAGNNQVWNGGLELLDALGFPVLWSRSEDSKWEPYTGDKHSGSRSIRTTGDMGKDDVLQWTDSRPVPVGALVRASAWAKRLSGTIGRLRLRTVYEGRFDPPDLLAASAFDDDWTNASEFPGDAVPIDSNTLLMGPCTRPQIVNNPSFEDGLSGWVITGGAGWAVVAGGTDGSNALSCIDLSGGTDTLLNDYDETVVGTQVFPVKQGHRFLCEADGWADVGTTGNCDVRFFTGNGTPHSLLAGDGAMFGGSWQRKQDEIDVQEDGNLIVSVNVWAMTAGQFKFDRILATRIKGNTAKYTAPAVTVTPEKSYKVFAALTGSWPESGPTRNGTLHYSIVLQGEGRADQVIVSSELDVSQAATEMVLDHSFTPPSGYDTVTVTLVGTDLHGGNVLISKPILRCEDTSTHIVDKVIGPVAAAWAQYTEDSIAPAGTERVTVYAVAEANGDGWALDDVDWHRREATTSIPSIIDALLRDPDTGEYLVTPGLIYPTGTPAWDWLIVNLTNREAMLELLRGGRCSPLLEFRHNPDNTFDVGTADQLARDSGLLFVDQDLLLLSRPEVESSVEDRLTRVKLIGAALQRHAPLPDAVITGEASTTIPGAYDWFGNPVRRTRILEDSAVNFQAFADARSQDELDRSADAGDLVNVEISEWSAWGDFRVGDWVHAYRPEALLEDRTNPKTYKGRRVYPKKTRALSRRLNMARGDGFQVKIRRPDGTYYDVPDGLVRWDDRTRATVELGKQRVDHANDPQGPGAGLQFLRFRASVA